MAKHNFFLLLKNNTEKKLLPIFFANLQFCRQNSQKHADTAKRMGRKENSIPFL